MKQDIEKLQITRKEIKEITGINVDYEYTATITVGIILGFIFIIPVGGIIAIVWGFTMGFKSLGFSAIKIAVIISYTCSCGWTVFELNRIRKIKKKISSLLKDVEEYNKIIKRIDVSDQLASAGNPVQLSEREQIINALAVTRENLIRALKTERILRENPNSDLSLFSIDLTPMNASQLNEQATEYGRLLNETLQIGVQVQKEMKDMFSVDQSADSG